MRHDQWTWLRLGALSGLLSMTLATAVPAQDATGGMPGSWLSQYSSARTMGLGGAYVASADNALGALWNPAGLSWMYQNEVAFEYGRLYEGTSLNAIGFTVPGNKLPTFGISMFSLRSGEFQKTNELNDDLGTFSEGDMAFLFTASKALSPRFSVGTNIKVVRQSIEEFSSGGVGFDLGGMYQVSPAIRVGASMLNVGGPSLTLRNTSEEFPIEFRGGFTAMLLGGRAMLSAQADMLKETGMRLHGGFEYWLQPRLALRMGYDNDAAPAGGVSYQISTPLQLDYGLQDQELGLAHRVGLSYRFGGFSAVSRAEPEIFSPTGTNSVTKIHLKAKTKANAESWTLQIFDKLDIVVREFGGKGLPPAHLLWDGKDAAGLPLADGTYRYQLVVMDLEGRRIESPEGFVEISTGGPKGDVPVIPVK
jgi:hypothetical protein